MLDLEGLANEPKASDDWGPGTRWRCPIIVSVLEMPAGLKWRF